MASYGVRYTLKRYTGRAIIARNWKDSSGSGGVDLPFRIVGATVQAARLLGRGRRFSLDFLQIGFLLFLQELQFGLPASGDGWIG